MIIAKVIFLIAVIGFAIMMKKNKASDIESKQKFSLLIHPWLHKYCTLILIPF
jgi:hypothetical protein